MKISVILAVFNGAKYLKRAIDSFLKQDYPDKELIIIDGKSTDESHKIIQEYQTKYSAQPDLIKWIKEKDSGISNARNIALKYVSGDLVGFLGADDILHKDFFKQIPYYAAINPNFDVMYFDSYFLGSDHNLFNPSSSVIFNKKNLVKFAPIAPGEAFYYKKEVFDKFKFNEKNKYCMDYELNLALLSDKNRSYSFYPVNVNAVLTTSDGNNISALFSKTQRVYFTSLALKYSDSTKEKLRIFLRKPKFFLRNLKEIAETYKAI